MFDKEPLDAVIDCEIEKYMYLFYKKLLSVVPAKIYVEIESGFARKIVLRYASTLIDKRRKMDKNDYIDDKYGFYAMLIMKKHNDPWLRRSTAIEYCEILKSFCFFKARDIEELLFEIHKAGIAGWEHTHGLNQIRFSAEI